MIGYIYSLENETTNDVFYIGKTLWPRERLLSHKISCNYYQTKMHSFPSTGI